MAYGKKYEIDYKSMANEDFTLEFWVDGWAGASTEVNLGGSGFVCHTIIPLNWSSMSPIEDQFKGMIVWQTKLTKGQELAKAGFQMFGDVLTSSLDSALNSQDKFFDVFIKNIKRAITSLMVQLAVMTLISSIMPGGLGKAAFTKGGIMTNLGKIMGFADGGLVTGPTVGLIGEGIGTTASNPEVIAPLDKLKQFIGGGSQNVIVEGVIKGNDIFLSNRNTGTNRQRSV